MVDAAIGGKTAINTKLGKNLLGCFHEPEEVWICSDFLRTLPSQDLMSVDYRALESKDNTVLATS
jgi:3-dehydroquinate synthase